MDIHFFLHPKGGIGKSQMAAATADYLKRQGIPSCNVDCDPSTDTFRRVKALDVLFFNIMSGDEVDSSKFDDMIMTILDSGAKHAVIDSGSGGYRALADYLVQGDMFGMLREQGHRPFIHTVLAGGAMMGVTVDGFESLAQLFPDGEFVIWLNPKFGRVVHDGMLVTKHPDYQRHQHLVRSVIALPQLNPGTYSRDLSTMLARGQVYTDADRDPVTTTISKHRLRQLSKAFDELLSQALVELDNPPVAANGYLYPE